MRTQVATRDDVKLDAGVPPIILGPSLVADELSGIASAVCARFPDRPRGEIEAVVSETYDYLRARARVTAHLIPLTLNRSLRLMREATEQTRDGTDAIDHPPPGRRTGWAAGRPESL